MIHVAKMVTRYPDFKGEGYYNFLIESDLSKLESLVHDNLHDYAHIDTIDLDISEADIMDLYPTKEDLNKEFEK